MPKVKANRGRKDGDFAKMLSLKKRPLSLHDDGL